MQIMRITLFDVFHGICTALVENFGKDAPKVQQARICDPRGSITGLTQ